MFLEEMMLWHKRVDQKVGELKKKKREEDVVLCWDSFRLIVPWKIVREWTDSFSSSSLFPAFLMLLLCSLVNIINLLQGIQKGNEEEEE